MNAVKTESYEAYKDSGVEWLGEVPKHWKVKRLKDTIAIALSYGANESATDSNPLHPRYIRITDFSDNETLKEETFKSLPPELANNYLLKDGDILLARSGATAGKTFHFKGYKGKACYAGYLIKARFKVSVLLPSFFSLYTKSFVYNDWRNSIVIKSTIENISAERYGFFLFIPTPPLLEQAAIATYLDTKTAQIDRQIDLLSQKVTQYGKLKQSLINETVIRGLDKTVPMKDSGVEWIGEVPESWEVTAVTNITDTVSHKNHPKEELLSVYRDYGVIIKSSRDDNHNKAGADLSSYKLVEPGYLVINKMKAWQGSLGVSEFKGIVSPAYITCKTNWRIVDRGYLHHLLRCRIFINEYNRLSFGVRVDQWDMRYDDFKYVPVLLPPLPEQIAIANYLNTKTAQIDRIVTTINSQIEKLKELRKVLINDVVTGKIKVVREG